MSQSQPLPLQTVVVPARCRTCGTPLEVRLEVSDRGPVLFPVFCDPCLSARADTIRAERHARERERTCTRGHLLAGENLVLHHLKNGRTHGQCRTCARAHNATFRARRAALKETA